MREGSERVQGVVRPARQVWVDQLPKSACFPSA